MGWIDVLATVSGALAALVAFVKLLKEFCGWKWGRTESRRWWVGRGKLKGLKYLKILVENEQLATEVDSFNAVKRQLTHELAIDIVQAYGVDKRGRRLSRENREPLVLIILLLTFFLLLSLIGYLERLGDLSSSAKAFVVNMIYLLCLYAFCVLLLLVIYVPILVSHFYYEIRITSALSRAQGVEISLSTLCDCVESNTGYLFVDATIRSNYQVPFMGVRDNVYLLLDAVGVDELNEQLCQSELKQLKNESYAGLVNRLIDSFVVIRQLRDRGPVIFVFSQCGLTAILVTQVLRSSGFRAFYIGATSGREYEMKQVIREIRMLRDSGLI